MKKIISVIMLFLIFMVDMSCTKTAEKWNRKAVNALSTKNFDEAISCYKKAITIDNNNFKAHYFLAGIYKWKGMLDEAIFEYKKAISIKPNQKGLHNMLGETYLEKGIVNEAIFEFKKSINIDPNFAIAHFNLGIAYKKQGQNKLADKYLYDAGFLALIQGNRKVALKVYKSLDKIEEEKLAKELYDLLVPLIGYESKER